MDEFQDLRPDKNPKGGSPKTPYPYPILPEKKKTKSDIIRAASIEEYVLAHAKPHNGGFRGFLHSNLFVALLLWSLSQAVVIGGFVISFYMKTSQLSEWKGQIDGTINRMDKEGTVHGHINDQREDEQIVVLDARMRRVEEDTRHIEVIESEHRRLTKDVEDLRNGKK